MELQWKFTFVFSCSEGFKKFAKLTGNALSDLIELLYLPAPSSKNTIGEADYNFTGPSSTVRSSDLIALKSAFNVWRNSATVVAFGIVHLSPYVPFTSVCFLILVQNANGVSKPLEIGLSVCVCGCDWSELPLDLRPEHEITVSRWIYQLCGLLPLDHPSSDRNRLQSLALQDFVIVLTFIAGLECEMSWATGRPSKSIKLRNKDLHT